MRFWIQRHTGYMSPYTLGMLYGAAVIAPRLYGSPDCPVFVSIWTKLIRVPPRLLVLARPFNRYWPEP